MTIYGIEEVGYYAFGHVDKKMFIDTLTEEFLDGDFESAPDEDEIDYFYFIEEGNSLRIVCQGYPNCFPVTFYGNGEA